MAYGRWLYKEIDTNRGSISLSIYKKNYTGNAIEINALVADSIVISIDGDGITAPIIGSSLSFSIVDTGQIDTSEFFTPDATMYRIDLSRDGTLEWSGYLTPDSYQENLAYRDTINLIARDNLGRLEEFQFLKSKGLQNMETFIADLLSEVGCPQVINWNVRKVSVAKGKGITEVTDYDDIWVNTELFVEKDYKEIVEMILTGLGCQMRYNGYNNLIITSLSDIPSFPTQSAIFINKSGFKEILPAWKDVTINQDYGLIENFFDGYLTEEQMGSGLTFIPNVQMPDKWTNNSKLSNLLFANPYEWKEGIEDGAEDSMFPALSNAGAAIWKKYLKSSSAPMEVKMYLNNTLRRLSNSAYKGIGNLFCGSDDTKDHILEYELRYQFLVSFVDSTGKERFMTRYGWADLEDDTNAFLESLFTRINFTTSPCKWDDESTWDQEQEVTISINNLTEDGELRVYIGNVYWGEKNEVPDNVFFGKIRDIRIAYKLDNGELASRLQVSDKHNINGRVELQVGQVPIGKGDYLAYAGGFFDSQGLPLTNFKRYYDDINNYILMELVAREHIHFNKDNYMALSGDMISDSPFSFRNNIVYKGERYALISASLAVISNTLSVTNMLQVTDYEVAELTTINSPLESGKGTKVGSGNREVLQFSNDAGNAKRLYELDFARDGDDIDNAYAIVDTDRWQEAKRVKVSELGGLFNKAFEVQMDADGNVTAVIAKANLGARGGIAARYQGNWGDTPVTPTINSLGDITDVQITNPTNGQGLVYRDGVWVNEDVQGGGDMSGYLPLSGGTITGDTDALKILRDTGGYSAISYYNTQDGVATLLGVMGFGANGEPSAYRAFDNTWRTLIHSGNIGSQSVASATKLQDSNGVLIYNNGSTFYIGDTIFPTVETHLLGKNIVLRYGASATYGLVLNESGNVLIGTATDNGNRLQVGGAISLATALRMTFHSTGTTCGLYPDSWISGADASRLWLYNTGKVAICGEQGVEIHSDLTAYGSISLTNELYCNGWLRSNGDRGWYNETYGGGIHMTDTNFIRTYDNKAFSASYYQMNYTNAVDITSSGNWYRVWEGDYYGSIILSLTHSWSNNQTDNLIFSISTGYQYGATSGITLLSRNIGTNTYQAIRVVYDGDIGKHCVEVFIGPSGSNLHWVSGIGHGVFLQPTLVTSTNLNQRCMMQIDYTATIQSSNNAVINGNIYASGGLTARYASSSSDARLKDNITLLSQEDAINTLMALKPSSWNWKDGGELAYGLVAQDVESVLPCSVTYGEHLSLQYNMFHAFEISVAQNHETRLQHLERENKELKQELQTLKREYYGR